MSASNRAIPACREREPIIMTPTPGQRATRHEQDNRAQFRAMLNEGQEAIRRVAQHACLLERRLRGGGNTGDLVVLVHALKFALADLQTLLDSAEQKVTKCWEGEA